MRVYLDSCCYNRAIEESEQESMSAESEAINYIIDNRETNGDVIIGSEALDNELGMIKTASKKASVQAIYSVISENISYDRDVFDRAMHFTYNATHWKDSLHLACAEKGESDVFLTVDYRLIREAVRLALRFRVMNPVEYAAHLKWD